MKFDLRTFNRMALTLTIGLSCVVLLLIAFHTHTSLASIYSTQSPNSVYTATHFIYLPLVSSGPSCTNPPSNTVMIAGQATVHGKPAQAGVPFSLWFQVFDNMPALVMTTTTRADGSFCLVPNGWLDSCRGMWYWVYFTYVEGTMPPDDYATGWQAMVEACEPGKVYTLTAEIGK